MALALIAVAMIFGTRTEISDEATAQQPVSRLWSGAAATVGLLVLIFGGFKSGFATATEISAFAALYALVIGGIVFRELSPGAAWRSFTQSAIRSGLIMFIVAAAQSLAFVLTLQQIPHALGDALIHLSQSSGTWLFMLLSIAILIVMGSVLEGAAALIIFGPLLVPVAAQLGIAPLHFGVVLVVAMGIGLFAPPLGLGLYGACLVGNVPIEQTVKPIMGYLGLLLICLLVIAFVPGLTLWLPHALGISVERRLPDPRSGMSGVPIRTPLRSCLRCSASNTARRNRGRRTAGTHRRSCASPVPTPGPWVRSRRRSPSRPGRCTTTSR